MRCAAVDIGGSWIRWRLSRGGEGRVPSSEWDPRTFLEKLVRQYGVERVGVSFAGQVDSGRIVASPNVRTDCFDIRKYFMERHGVDLRIENDLNCAALAEAKARGIGSLAALYSGTGLGAGIIEGGRLCRGSRGMAGEIGHVPYRRAPFRCGCGKENCLELFASGSALRKWSAYRGCPGSDLRSLQESERPECRGIAAAYEEALLTAAGILVTLYNPSVLVLGGGVVEANPRLMEGFGARLADYALPVALEGARIEKSRLHDAPLKGAEILAGFGACDAE